MRRLFKWTFRLVFTLVLAIAVLGFGRNLILRLLLEKRLTEATGFETSIGRVQIEFTSPAVRFFHVRLFNPPRLGGKPFVDILEARVTYDLTDLFSRRFRVRELQVLISDVRFVRQDLRYNTQAILARSQNQARNLPDALVDPLKFLGVDRLVLSAERYRYDDFLEMTQSQDVLLGLRGMVATNLVQSQDWTALWRNIAQAKGIRPPPTQAAPPLSAPPPPQS